MNRSSVCERDAALLPVWSELGPHRPRRTVWDTEQGLGGHRGWGLQAASRDQTPRASVSRTTDDEEGPAQLLYVQMNLLSPLRQEGPDAAVCPGPQRPSEKDREKEQGSGHGRAHCLSPQEELTAELTILLEDDKTPEL